MITKCDKSQISRNLWLSHFVMVQNATSQIHVRSASGYTPQCRKRVDIDVEHHQEGFLSKSMMDFMTDIHAHKQIYEWIAPKWAQMQLFIFLSKVNIGSLPNYQNTFSVLLDSVCAVTAMITKCDKSHNATARIPDFSQFVTVAFCDGSKYNFLDSCS